MTFPTADTTVFTGDIIWGRIDPVPVALGLSASTSRLSTGQTGQLSAIAIAEDASTRNVTARTEGTTYSTSSTLLATVSENGLVTVLPLFAPGSSSRVVATAVTEGGAAASYMFTLGPRGSLKGKVTRADGITPVAGAEISVLRTQPMEHAGTISTDAAGSYQLNDVNAGQFRLTVIDVATGDRGQAFAKIENEGEDGVADVKLNGQGAIVVTVVDGNNSAVPNSLVTLTALGQFLDTRTGMTDSTGKVTFDRVAAGDFTISTRDRASGLVGTALGALSVGAVIPLTLRLQPVGTIKGQVFGIDGSTPQEGVQVRIISRERGLITQLATAADGSFSFNSLPLSDGPFTLDAFVDGRLRARIPGLVLSSPNQILNQNLVFNAVGTVSGLVSDASGQIYFGATVTLQMTEGLRFAFETRSDASGRFYFPGVPVGNFTISAAKDGRTGSVQGRINADNETVPLNVQLATNSLIGTVFQRDSTTPAAGVTVYLVPSRISPALTVNPMAAGVLKTTTNTLGQFGFPIPTTDTYTLQAENGTDRGRTQVVITTIDPARPVQVTLSFLPKGTVSGSIRDASGTSQPNVNVSVSSNGVFNNTWTVNADSAGRYTVPDVFVGDIVALAQNAQTRLAGSASGRLLAEGANLNLDVTLAATGSIMGQVLKRDGSVVATPLKLDLSAGFSAVNTLNVENGNSYRFDLVSVGDVSITATEISTGDKGIATTRITAANDVKTLNVRMVGQGMVKVKVVDEINNPVAAARVVVRTSIPFASEQTLTTDVGGNVTFAKVFAGDFSVNASKAAVIGARSGSASGTLVADSESQISIALANRPIGKIKGVLFGPDGVTPRAGMLMRMTPEPFLNAYRVITDAEGKYEFSNIESGSSYSINARLFDDNGCYRDRVRAQVTGVQISQQDQEVVRNLQMIGAGRVSGRVVDASGNGIGGIRLRIVNPDPVYGLNGGCRGTFYETYSAADGSYIYGDIPAGDFTITAENLARTLRAEGRGRIRFDADEASLDLTLVDSAVSMPYTLHDANAMPFDIAGDGSVNNGKNGIFRGTGTNSRGMRLDVVVDGVPVPFLNGDGSIGRLSQSGREIQVDEDNAASKLKVTRKVFVPRTGYFARYLEVLENKTADPITVGLRVTTHHSQSNANPRVVDSSDGDQILSVASPANRDRWIVVDDQEESNPFRSGSVPATGHLFDGEAAVKQVDSASYQLVGQTGKLNWQWNNITVAPGKSVALMHFVFNQLDRYDARQAALRLAQLPPEALEALTTDEREAIINFKVPAEGTNTIEPLPAVDAGVIKGQVLSGDGVTPIAGALVRFRSKLALYGRDFYTTSNGAGNFEFRARTDGTANALALPLYTFEVDTTHPKTAASSANAVGDFVAPATEVVKDLIFIGTGNLRGTVKRHSGGLVDGAFVKICTDNFSNCTSRNYDSSRTDGSYLMSGSLPGDYFLFAEKSHPQQGGGGLPIRGSATTTITAGNTNVTDVVMEQTGTLTGVVRAANGDPAENVDVFLFFGGTDFARQTKTDTAGRYRFFDVRIGAVRVDARDPISSAVGSGAGSVVANEEAMVDIGLKGFGTINVQVNFARGVPAPNAAFYYGGERSGNGRSDSGGKANVSVPVGSYNLTASHPDDESNAALRGAATTTLVNNGDSVNVVMTLKSSGAVKGTIVRPDGSTLAGGFPYTIKLINGATSATVRSSSTNAAGQYRSAGLVFGLYILTAYDPVQNRFADAEFEITADGQEAQLDIVVEDNRIALPADLFDANRFRFDVQQSGQLTTGHYWTFDQGGAKLEVNGTPFVGDTSALLEAGKRQFAITQEQPITGLKVTRKIFVPRGAYFARYLEVFENPTSAPIALDAKLSSRYAAAQVIATSSGDEALTVADKWLTMDDAFDVDPFLADGQQPATAHVFANVGAAKLIDQADFTTTTDGNRILLQRWSNLTVPAGGKLVLMHFVVQQVNRAGAKAAAERLTNLPPEAIQSLTQEEGQAIVNFVMPANGESMLQPLPALTGSINGRVFEGDGRTAVAGVRVTFQSMHPLFNRVWGMAKDPFFHCTMAGTAESSLRSTAASAQANAAPAGSYSIAGRLTNIDSLAVPEGVEVRLAAQEAQPCFGYFSGHSWTHIRSREYRANASVNQDVLFDSGILTGTISGYPDLQATGGRMYLSTDNTDSPEYRYISLLSDGTYTYPGLPAGIYDVLADIPHSQGSGLRGSRSRSIVTLANTTVTDVQLQPAGSIQGAIITANGEASVNARVRLNGSASEQTYDQCASDCVADTLAQHKGKRSVTRETRTDSLGRYNFAAVPVGGYSMAVTDPISDGIKQVTLAVAQGQIVVQNVTLLPVGSVQLAVKLPGGQPAVDAFVYLYADAQGFEETVGRTNAQGLLTIANIPQGGYTLRVRDPRRPNDNYFDRRVSGNIASNGDIQQHSIFLLAAANLRVTTVDADNANALLVDASVSLQDVRSSKRFVGNTDGNGILDIANVPQGDYTVEVTKVLDGSQVTATSGGQVGIADDTQLRTVNVPMRRTLGSVRITLVDQDTNNTPIAGASVYFRAANQSSSVLVGTTDSAGRLLIPGVPVGNFTATARATLNNAVQEAEVTGSITAANIGRPLEVLGSFKSTLVMLPHTLHDASQFPYDVQADGSIGHGHWFYYGAFNGGASMLEVNGTAFTGTSHAKLEAGKRQLSLTQLQIGGLDVTRKIYIPKEGYFARHLEIFENRSSSPVTLNAKLSHKYHNRSITATSSGDAALQTGDNWVTIDDAVNGEGDPFTYFYDEAATAHIHGQSGAAKTLDAAAFESDSSGYYGSYLGNRLVQSWDQIVVPANGRVTLMHFVVQQVNRAASQSSAERLVQLPPEAIENMTASELASVINFVIPVGGQSTLNPLPPLNGVVQGRTLEGDGTTPVANATVSIQSAHPLFARQWRVTSDDAGQFSLSGQISDTSNSIPIPLDAAVNINARHYTTQLLSPTYAPLFAAEGNLISQDVLFQTGSVVGRVVSPIDYAVTGVNYTYIQAYLDGELVPGLFYLNADGSYRITGLKAGTYQLRLTAYHDQGTALSGTANDVTVTVGSTTTADLPVQATGSVVGVLRKASGSVSSGEQVVLLGLSGNNVTRYATTNAQGQYRFTAVPIGRYEIYVIDNRNGAKTSATTEVTLGQSAVQDLTQPGVATVQVATQYAKGTVATGIPVYLMAAGVTNEQYIGNTNAMGRLTVFVPVGTYSIRVQHPRGTFNVAAPFNTVVTGTVNTDGETASLTMVLKAVADVRVTVVDADNGNTPISGAAIYHTDGRYSGSYFGTTNAAGQLLVRDVPEGNYRTTARLNSGRQVGINGSIDASADGLTLNKTINATTRLDELGILNFEGERRLYSVAANAGDTLNISAFGEAHSGKTALPLTRISIYGPGATLLAKGYKYPGFNGQAYSEIGNITSVSATATGYHTVAVESYYGNGSIALGAYRVTGLVNGATADLLVYQDGGSVVGTVFKGDGVTPAADETVSISTLDNLGLYVRATTDATGQYRFDNVPLGQFHVAVVDKTTNLGLVSAGGSLANAAATAIRDLTLPAKSPLTVTIRRASGEAYGAGVRVDITDIAGQRTLYTNSLGQVMTIGYGSNITIRATDPNNYLLSATETAAAIDGQAVSVTITIVSTSLSGQIQDGAGNPSAGYVVVNSEITGQYLSEVFTYDGRFTFPSLPAGDSLLLIAYNYSLSIYDFMRIPPLVTGEARNVIFKLVAGSATGKVQTAAGMGIAGIQVRAEFLDAFGYRIYRYATTDEAGQYRFDASLPVGREVKLFAESPAFQKEVAGSVTVAQSSAVAEAAPLIVSSGQIQVRIRDIEGKSVYIPGLFGLVVNGNLLRYTDGSDSTIPAVPDGTHEISLVDYSSYRTVAVASVSVVEGNSAEALLLVAVVKGTVKHSDNLSIAAGGAIYLIDAVGRGYFASTTDDGRYSVIGVAAGDFTITATDVQSGLRQSVTGNLASAGGTAVIDMVLPPSGTVTGVFRDAAGSPIANASLSLRSTGLEFDRLAATDANGIYVIDRVALGTVSLLAQDPASLLTASTTLTLSSDRQLATADLTLGIGGSIRGVVFSADGITPIAGAEVRITSSQSVGSLGAYSRQTVTDGAGRFEFSQVPPGQMRLETQNPTNSAQLAVVTLELGPDGVVEQTLVVGSAVRLPYDLKATDGFIYDVSCTGALGDGGTIDRSLNDAYDGAYYLSVSGVGFPCATVVPATLSSRELKLGPFQVGGVNATRRIYVPPSGGFVRYFDEIENTSSQTITVPVRVSGNLGSDSSTRIIVSPTVAGKRYAVTTDSTTNPVDPPLAHVFYDGNAASQAPTTQFLDFYDAIFYEWMLSIPPGQKQAIMTFGVQRRRSEVSQAQAQAESLTAKTDANMLNGLSAQDKESVRNFFLR